MLRCYHCHKSAPTLTTSFYPYSLVSGVHRSAASGYTESERMRLILHTAIHLTPRYGANLITNGTFDSATTGWTATNSPTTFESSGGRAHIVTNGNIKGFQQSFALVLGATYRMEYEYEVVLGTGFTVTKVGMPTQTAQTGTGSKAFTFQATSGASTALQFLTSGAVDHEFYIDNIRIRRIL